MEPQQMGRKQRSKLLTVCPFILGNELCERLAFYGIATNLVVYLKVLGANNLGSTIISNVFNGLCYTLPLLGGYMGDAIWGRYKTILNFSIAYSVGMTFLTLTAGIPGLHPEGEGNNANSMQWTVFLLSLLLIAIGTGGIKANVSSFGADQFDDTIPQDRREKTSFFNWFYLFINVGALLASTVIVHIQENQGWALGFLVPGVAMVLAVVFFLLGTPLYKHIPISGSALGTFLKVSWSAFTHREQGSQQPMLGSEEQDDDEGEKGKAHWLDKARSAGGYSRQEVYDVKLVWGIFPIFLTNIFYWMVYSQITNTFILQGGLMNRNVSFGSHKYEVAPAQLVTFDTLIIVTMIPVYDRVVVPLLGLCNIKISHLQRMGYGYAAAVLSMVVAFFIENRRLSLFHDGKVIENAFEHGSAVVDMSIWYQSAQYVLVGISEVLASIAQLEFYYDQAPDTMKSMLMALNLLAVALGSYSAGILASVLNGLSGIFGQEWMPDDLNKGRLDLYFLVIAGLMAIVAVVFTFIAMRYKYKHVPHGTSVETMEDNGVEREGEDGAAADAPL